MPHGDDEAAQDGSPDGRVRDADPGSVAAIEGSPEEPEEPTAGNGSLEGRWPSPVPRDDVDAEHLQVKSAELALLASIEARLESKWEGPLPPPAVLAQYEQILPGLADRIVSMAETTATGTIMTDDKLADAEIGQANTGQAMAFTITLIAIVASIVFFAVGMTVPGGLLLSFPVIMLVRSFLLRR